MTFALAAEEHAYLVEAALKFVNEGREKLGLPAIKELPKGAPKCSATCPIAKGLTQGTRWTAIVNGLMARVLKKVGVGKPLEPHDFWVPAVVAEFIHRFDLGLIPDLVEVDE